MDGFDEESFTVVLEGLLSEDLRNVRLTGDADFWDDMLVGLLRGVAVVSTIFVGSGECTLGV